jgi:hypothetical protein
MLSECEQVAHKIDHALTMMAVLGRVDPGNLTLKEIEDALDAAYLELTRHAVA